MSDMKELSREQALEMAIEFFDQRGDDRWTFADATAHQISGALRSLPAREQQPTERQTALEEAARVCDGLKADLVVEKQQASDRDLHNLARELHVQAMQAGYCAEAIRALRPKEEK